MRKIISIYTISILLISCTQNDTKQKELELKERELAVKERELALKEKDSVKVIIPVKEIRKTPVDTKILILMSPTYFFGDVAHLGFKDYTTHIEEDYEWDGDIPALNEIFTKCEDHDGCPALKGQVYQATLKFMLMDIYDFDNEGNISPTGKKNKRWAIVALKKIDKP